GGQAAFPSAVVVGVVLDGVTAVQAINSHDPETAVYKTIDSGVDVAAAAGGGFLGGALAFVFDLLGGSRKMMQGYAYSAVAQSAAGLAMIFRSRWILPKGIEEAIWHC
ncbi:MAG TPA: hypothetical protein VMC02_01885, partial [Steroidobacteraceae bacterium]|nr:hypothetical protein [Steroidobacteraceae bacterium]